MYPTQLKIDGVRDKMWESPRALGRRRHRPSGIASAERVTVRGTITVVD